MNVWKRVLTVLGIIVAVIIGIMIIPKIMKRITGCVYKNSHDEIEFENMGPEVVKKTKEEETSDVN